MSMAEVIESIEHDAFACTNPLEGLTDARCSKCSRLLGKFSGQAEIKCPKCGEINRIGVK